MCAHPDITSRAVSAASKMMRLAEFSDSDEDEDDFFSRPPNEEQAQWWVEHGTCHVMHLCISEVDLTVIKCGLSVIGG